MSFTRFHDDPCRIAKQLQESTGPGRYMVDVPGNGAKPCFMEDPFVRLQKWGANLQTNTINLESELLGLGRNLNRDCQSVNRYDLKTVDSKKVQYPSCQPFTDQTRASNPAWTVRDIEQNNWEYLPLDPQENVCIPFQNNLNTRLLESDYFVPELPQCLSTEPGPLYAGNMINGGCVDRGTCGPSN